MNIMRRNVFWLTLVMMFMVLQLYNVNGYSANRRQFWPGRWSNFHGDGAEDPQNVDDNFGWSWGQSSNQHHSPHRRRPPHNNGFNRPSSNLISGRTTTTQPPPTIAPTPEPIEQTTQANAASVVYSDEFYECMARCTTTSEYNPVCGSNDQSYQNIAKLHCANNCGANVQFSRMGPCQPSG